MIAKRSKLYSKTFNPIHATASPHKRLKQMKCYVELVIKYPVASTAQQRNTRTITVIVSRGYYMQPIISLITRNNYPQIWQKHEKVISVSIDGMLE